jgi:hypothetical protein
MSVTFSKSASPCPNGERKARAGQFILSWKLGLQEKLGNVC